MKIVVAFLLASATSASAATITEGGPLLSDPGLIHEDFSSYLVCGQSGDLVSRVGRFSVSGGPGEKGTVCGDANTAQVRQGTRAYVALSGRNGSPFWLDSNDNPRMTLVTRAQKLQFQTSDLGDVGGYFKISAGNATWELDGKQTNGERWLFTVIFDQGEDRVVHLESVLNDGFSVNSVASSPIPLPAAGFLLLGGVGALVAARRLRRDRQA